MLLVVERELGGPNEDPDAKFADLNMLVVPGGRERTVDEFAALFARTGFELVGAMPTAAAMSVIEARPAPAAARSPARAGRASHRSCTPPRTAAAPFCGALTSERSSEHRVGARGAHEGRRAL